MNNDWEVQVRANGKSAWFGLPVSYSALENRLGEFDDYTITEYHLPFSISEGTRIEKLNDLANRFTELPVFIRNHAKAIIAAHYSDVEEFLENADSLTVIEADNKKNLGHALVDDLDIKPDDIWAYFDYEAYAKDFGTEVGGVFIDGAYVY